MQYLLWSSVGMESYLAWLRYRLSRLVSLACCLLDWMADSVLESLHSPSPGEVEHDTPVLH